MHNHQSFAAIAFEANGLGQDPAFFHHSIAAAHLEMAKALWMLRASLSRDSIHTTPLPIPEKQAGALKLAHPMLAGGFNQLRQGQG